MVIYIDVLVFTNAVIDYIILVICELVTKRTYSVLRLISASVFGGICSLYILLKDTPLVIDIAFKVMGCAVMLLIASGRDKLKNIAYSYLILLIISFSVNGAVTFIYNFVNSETFYSDNMMEYINISPLVLISVTAVIYIVIRLIQRANDRRASGRSATLMLTCSEFELRLNALIDSGHNVTDPFGNSQIFFVRRDIYEKLTHSINNENRSKRLRLVPIKTVGERCLMNAFRCDSANITYNGKNFKFINPVIVEAQEEIDDFDAIISSNAVSRFAD